MSAADEFAKCCASQRWFVDEGWVEKQVAVDILQFFAEAAGYLDELGQDEVQLLMAEAFAPIEALPSDYAATLVMQWELADPRDRWRWTGELPPVQKAAAIERPPYRTAQSTVDAFHFVMSLADPERLAAWLRNHSDDALVLLETLEAA
ncbi:hypothetical protein [Bradyrhizobium diazoefficiens]|uniref:hypothetical protein n=1 Tax=Bradyrhizobium diazoefficiens TaxID=1355477 RepID=UPI002714D585|nr:hypothetical protein [Bradyrhizobium diazoefficiens]WLB35007.1 hypothetical protein QIH78_26345 [Bradyrhizobium diazoefficiens]WLC19996.1 hypothetical protein QIH76_17310 [Bradyrhizobium diazoefficiens]